ncbi:hypothetical protein GCM10027053_52020 [Intrasporangium mesophilum]
MKSWEDVAPEPLAFPINGKVYTVPELPYDAMLTIQKVKAGEYTVLEELAPEQTWRLIMGDAWDEMVDDNVPAEAIGRAGLATLVYFEQGREAAEVVWENGIDPKALATAIRLRTTQPESPRPTSTDEASVTPSPAPTSGTSSRPASSKKKARMAATPS